MKKFQILVLNDSISQDLDSNNRQLIHEIKQLSDQSGKWYIFLSLCHVIGM